MTRLATPISDHVHTKTFLLFFSLCEFVSTCKKADYFIDLFWRYGRLKNLAISLTGNIFTHVCETKVFPDMGFV